MDYLVVKEAEDGTWYDEGHFTVGLEKARRLAQTIELPKGYSSVVYELRYIETVKDGEPFKIST